MAAGRRLLPGPGPHPPALPDARRPASWPRARGRSCSRSPAATSSSTPTWSSPWCSSTRSPGPRCSCCAARGPTRRAPTAPGATPSCPCVFILASLALVAQHARREAEGVALRPRASCPRPAGLRLVAAERAPGCAARGGVHRRRRAAPRPALRVGAWGTLLSRESRSSRTPSPSTSCSACSRCCWWWSPSREQLPGRPRGGALLRVLQELIPFGRETLAESVREPARVSPRASRSLSLLLIVWGSSGIFMPVEMALNKAWGGGRTHRASGRAGCWRS